MTSKESKKSHFSSKKDNFNDSLDDGADDGKDIDIQEYSSLAKDDEKDIDESQSEEELEELDDGEKEEVEKDDDDEEIKEMNDDGKDEDEKDEEIGENESDIITDKVKEEQFLTMEKDNLTTVKEEERINDNINTNSKKLAIINVRDERQKRTSNILTSYEFTLLICIRSSQISKNGVYFCKTTNKNADEIAKDEMRQKVFPLVLKRAIGNINNSEENIVEIFNVNTMVNQFI